MARLDPLSFAALSPEQQAILSAMRRPNRTVVVGPYSVLVRVPEIAAIVRNLSLRLHHRTRLDRRLFEVMVLTVVRSWSAQYAWFAHEADARAVGISDAVIAAIRSGNPDPPFANEDERAVFAVADELQRTNRVSDASYGRALALLGVELLIELVATIGFYNLISVVLDAFEVPIPDEQPARLPEPGRSVSVDALRNLFIDARPAHAFLPRPVDRSLLLRAAEFAELGPTSGNTLPMRIVFVTSLEGKQRLRPALGSTNLAQTMQAPVTAICAVDRRFYEHLERTNPHGAPRMTERWGDPLGSDAAQTLASDQALLQMGYLTLALRAVGLDCGATTGFDRAKVDAEFFADGRLRSAFLLDIGFADESALKPHAPRLTLDELVTFV